MTLVFIPSIFLEFRKKLKGRKIKMKLEKPASHCLLRKSLEKWSIDILVSGAISWHRSLRKYPQVQEITLGNPDNFCVSLFKWMDEHILRAQRS